jgi:hypothetical protein
MGEMPGRIVLVGDYKKEALGGSRGGYGGLSITPVGKPKVDGGRPSSARWNHARLSPFKLNDI